MRTPSELLFHLLFLLLLLALGAIRIWYYREQRRSMGLFAIKKQAAMNDVRQIGALLGCALIVAHILSPDLLSWTEFPLPVWARMIGAFVAAMAIGASWVVGRDDLAVARGIPGATFDPPGMFRWVRHPLELVLVAIAVGVTLLSANWVVALLASALAVHGMLVRAPRVERERRARIGAPYEAYARATPAFLPTASRSELHEAD